MAEPPSSQRARYEKAGNELGPREPANRGRTSALVNSLEQSMKPSSFSAAFVVVAAAAAAVGKLQQQKFLMINPLSLSLSLEPHCRC